MTKRYGNVTVLSDVDFDVRAGEIHALLGANGAGKSTLCKMIAGLTDVSAGVMQIGASEYAPKNKQDAESSGVQIIQQELNLIPTLSVAENLFLTQLPATAGIVRRSRLLAQARTALDRLQLHSIDPDTIVGRLGVGRRQMVEIAAALASDCRVLILDEPTAALSGSETQVLFEQLNQLRARGVGMIYISHRLDEVKEISDRVTVLRDGRTVATERTAAVSTDEMVDLMTGETHHAGQAAQQQQSASTARVSEVNEDSVQAATRVVLRVDSVSSGIVRDVSFDVRAGEVFGVAGLVGSGRTELLRAIFGADIADAGTVSVAGRKPRRFRHPREAVEGGLAMVTEDRKHSGLLLEQSVRCNTTLGAISKRFSKFGLVRHRDERAASDEMCRIMKTRCSSGEQQVGELSGGNQQKVAIAKWLARDADVFLFDEPTRGIDVGARRRIYLLFEELSASEKGIVIVSSDLDELFETCDRIAVMSAGRMVEIFEREDWSEDAILQASFAGHREARSSR